MIKERNVMLFDGFEIHVFLENAGLAVPYQFGLNARRMLCKRIRKIARKSGVLAEYDSAIQHFVNQNYHLPGTWQRRDFILSKLRFEEARTSLQNTCRPISISG